MNIDNYGRVIASEDEIFDAIYSGKIKNPQHLFLNNAQEVSKYNKGVKTNADSLLPLNTYTQLEDSIELFDEANRCDWFMPEEYLKFPLEKWLLDKCQTEIERTRVIEELSLFIQHDMFDLLFYLKYLVDTMRINKIVWGVGRGSSVASYVLFLIGIHKIDSIKYDLDITEFLK